MLLMNSGNKLDFQGCKCRGDEKSSAQKPRVLMFCVSFFGYEKRIAQALQDSGYEVDLFDERPGNGFIDKVCVRKNIKIYRGVIRRYVQDIIEKQKEKKYDYVFVVKGEAIGEKEIAILRQAYPNAKFVLYLWDSVRNIPDCEKRMPCYDRVLTFDSSDAEKYGITFLPIPYGKEHVQHSTADHYEYDVAFIGTAHSIRPRVVKQVEEICRKNGRKCFTYFYSPHILVYFLNRLTNPNYRWIKRSDVHFESLSTEETCRIFNLSKCILDVEHPRQSGTTTRPVEMLPMRKKIISTNVHVKDFLFYNENNFCIIDRDNPQIDERFWDLPYVDVAQEVIDRYSPEQFVRTLMEGL